MRWYITLMVGMLLASTGCGKTESDYKPTVTVARDVLTAGLAAWKEGEAATEWASTQGPPTVHFTDFQWSQGRKLINFQLLEEEPTLEGSTQRFRAELELAGEKPQQAEYYVVGIDPLWIMRDRDYQQTSMQ